MPQKLLPNDIRLDTLADAARWRGLKVGLYGGSFNPGHEGHAHVALHALKRLGLDAVWLMVSPGNPLKTDHHMAPFSARLESAHELSDRHTRLITTDIEARLGSRYTAETIESLTKACPRTRFVWLMGADNMVQFPLWHRFDRIVRALPVAIFDRPRYSIGGFAGLFAERYRRFQCRPGVLKARLNARQVGTTGIGQIKTPIWAFIRQPRRPISATMIRDQLGADWLPDANLEREEET